MNIYQNYEGVWCIRCQDTINFRFQDEGISLFRNVDTESWYTYMNV